MIPAIHDFHSNPLQVFLHCDVLCIYLMPKVTMKTARVNTGKSITSRGISRYNKHK